MGCGHECCDFEDNEYHCHCVTPEKCHFCELKRGGWQLPTVSSRSPRTSSEATGEHEIIIDDGIVTKIDLIDDETDELRSFLVDDIEKVLSDKADSKDIG